MSARCLSWLVLAGTSIFLAACGSKEPQLPTPIKPVNKVTGKVTVNGKAEKGVAVAAMPIPLQSENPTISSGSTDENGSFSLNTYKADDGVPAGDYVLTFKWGSFNPFRGSISGDKFRGKYEDANVVAEQFPNFKFTVKQGEALELPAIDLKMEEAAPTGETPNLGNRPK